MFKNRKKGRLYGINKITTYVDNPPIENTTTKITRSINFSKSNFINLGKWILIIVLFLYFGSYTINGFIASNITKDSTEETIVHEYKKQIGTELIGGNFDDFTYDNFGELTFNKKIFFKKQVPTASEIISISSSSSSNSGSYGLRFVASNFKLYDANNNLLHSYRYNTEFTLNYHFRIKAYSTELDYLYFSIYRLSGVQATVYICDIIGNQVANNPNYNIKYPTASYFTFSSYYDSSSNIAFHSVGANRITFSENLFNIILNDNLIYDDFSIVPIYETTTYSYDIKDINYNWDYKLKQISKFRPLFNSKDLFVDEEFYKYSNLITYQLRNDEIEIQNTINKYKSDERLTILFDNDAITLKMREYNYHLNKNKKDYISYIYFNFENIDFTDNQVYNAYNYALENYVSATNIDDYLIYSKMNFDAKDILILMSFPIQIVMNTLYNFGVLVGIVTLW